jgi:ABC-2 type transport system permease protein
MNANTAELILGPARAIRRAGILWTVSIAGLVALTVAMWPAFRDSSSVDDIMGQLPSGIVEAFGLQGFSTPAGFLRGNLYDFFIPLLLAGAAIGFVNSLLSSEEDGGRLEVILTQPVKRQWVFAGRAAAALTWTSLATVVTAMAQFGTDALVDLQIGSDKLLATMLLCWLLALFHGGLALAVAGLWPKPSLVLGVGLFVAVGGVIVSALFPLSPTLEPLAHLTPWDWALSGDPLVHGTDAWRYLALGVPAVLMAAFGTWAFARRDVAAA